jgi:hypothetical protein
MTQFDQALKARAACQDCPIPPALDGQVSAILNDLPRRDRSTRPLRPLRAALLAAALCLLCAVSALALSPTLRERLTAALGGFQPYMQEIDGAACVANGIEIRVVSAVADSSMVQIYVEARDLEEDRLSADLSVYALVEREGAGDGGYSFSDYCVGFDEETGTALLEISAFGTFPSDLEGMRLKVLSLYPTGDRREASIGGEQIWTADLNVEVLPDREIPLTGTVDGMKLMQARISPLGLTLVTSGERGIGDSYRMRVYLEDGTIVCPRLLGAGGDSSERITYWAFDDPVDPDQVTGISIHAWMIPLEGATAGEGYWLSQLPQ